MSDKKYHFISGLPRSGSTLLTSILNQNPDFHSSLTDSVAGTVKGMIQTFHANPGFSSEVPQQRRVNAIKGYIDGYYKDVDKKVVFNTNRIWTYSTHIVKDLYPDAKMILCVRDIKWILDSFELAYRRNPLYVSNIYGQGVDNVYQRCDNLMDAQGIVGLGYLGLKQAIMSNERNNLLIVEYVQLCKNPEGMMTALYNFIKEPYFEHDFNNVEKKWDEYDAEVGMELHSVKKKVEFKPRENCVIPPDILHKYSNLEVWRM